MFSFCIDSCYDIQIVAAARIQEVDFWRTSCCFLTLKDAGLYMMCQFRTGKSPVNPQLSLPSPLFQ